MTRVLAPVLIALVGVGCTRPDPKQAEGQPTSPATMCGHLVDLLSAALAEQGHQLSTEERRESEAACIEDAELERTRDEAQYRAQSTCIIAAKTFTEVEKCDRHDGPVQGETERVQ